MILKYNKLLIGFALVLTIIVSSCGNQDSGSEEKSAAAVPASDPILIDKETNLLLDDLKENGDYVNSRDFPSLIKASIVKESIGKNVHIIDIRSHDAYNEGHIKGSVNVNFESLPTYLTSDIKPFEYDRIIIACEDGQASSYTTSLLRLMGYGNVYAMRWGMSAWNTKLAKNGWLSGTSSEFQDAIETKTNSKPSPESMPVLNTGSTSGEEIGTLRFESLFAEGLDVALVDASEVFENPNNFFVINYDRKDKHENGHIPGAVRYKPAGTLSFVDQMASIPHDKTVVVYCGTGHNSGFVTAYFRLFGYDARTLKYGNNGFMYNKMVEEKSTLSWLPFSSKDINDFTLSRN